MREPAEAAAITDQASGLVPIAPGTSSDYWTSKAYSERLTVGGDYSKRHTNELVLRDRYEHPKF